MKLIYVFIVMLVPVVISAQSDKLKGKVIDDSKKPVSNLLIRFTSIGDAVTTGSGEFVISVPQNARYVDVVIKDDSLQLLYPVDSKIPIPSDPNFVTTIIVSKIKSLNTGVNESVKKYAELEKLLKESGSTNKELQDFMKRYVEIESERLEMDKAKLEYEFKKKENRDEIFSTISPVFTDYILKLKDLKTTFETNFEIAFVTNPGTDNLNKAIGEYNPLFDTLNSNYKNWQREISSSWDDNLSEKFGSAVNYMIDEIHKPYIFQLNESIKIINEIKFRIEKDEEKREEKKKEVRNNISFIMKNLEIKIPILENRFNELLNILQFAEVN